jgi:RNA polymerase sigma-70 factor, ECF subfamily
MDIEAQKTSREAEIERLMALYQDSLLRMCFVYLHDMALAEDALQETFLKAYNRYDTFRGDSSEKTWLIRIAINTCKDMRRSNWFRRRISLQSVPEPVCAFTPADETLIKQVMALPAKYKEAVLLFYYHGMTADEVADALHIAKPTVYQRLKKAQEKLKCELEGWYENE